MAFLNRKHNDGLCIQEHREKLTLKSVEENNFFSIPNCSFIAHKCRPHSGDESGSYKQDKESEIAKLSNIYLINLRRCNLSTLGDIGLCLRLRICRLAGNHLTDISNLCDCVNLSWLDLHSNQLEFLPDGDFWQNFPNLKLINLHDNPLATIDLIQSLSRCPDLLALTLYDSPLSLKKYYRHHVVNMIWSLKALDRYVIADEEIVEDADFGGKFTALSSGFLVNLCPWIGDDTSYSEESELLKLILKRISSIMARMSPVIIVQKIFRGIIVRNRYREFLKTNKWCCSQDSAQNIIVGDDVNSSSTAIRMSHDEANGSIAPTASVILIPKATVSSREVVTPLSSDASPALPAESRISLDNDNQGGFSFRRDLLIDLSKLQEGTMHTLNEDAFVVESIIRSRFTDDGLTQDVSPSKVSLKTNVHESNTKAVRKKKEKRQCKNTKYFFGSVVPCLPPIEESSLAAEDSNVDTNDVCQFRLQGFQKVFIPTNASKEMYFSKQREAKNIRQWMKSIHKDKNEIINPVNSISTRSRAKKNRKNDLLGVMCLAAFRAVDDAYKDRSKVNSVRKKAKQITGAKEKHKSCRAEVQRLQALNRTEALQKCGEERDRIQASIERQNECNAEEAAMRRNRNEDFKERIRAEKEELKFARDFCSQIASISHALQKHGQSALKTDDKNEQSQLLQKLHADEKERQEIVKRYFEHRQVFQGAKMQLDRSTLDSQLLKDASQRLIDARKRVEHEKAKRFQVEVLYPASASIHPKADVNAKEFFGLDRFSTLVKVANGRVGVHPIMY